MTDLDPRRRDDLPAILDDAWARLFRGAASGRHAFHTPTFATIDGEAPDARAVVLRKAIRAERALVCHTDVRSPKAAQLADHPRAVWCFYDAGAKLQLRCLGQTTVHVDDALADERWQASALSSRRCYLAPHPPGEPSDAPSPNLPEAVRGRVPDADETKPGRAHFAVIRTVIDRLDWLYLAHDGHRRARFTWSDQGDLAATWLHV